MGLLHVSVVPLQGDKHNGFAVLYRNMKHGQLCSAKELHEFLKLVSVVEEEYYRHLAKLVKQLAAFGTEGSFSPVWGLVRTYVESHADLHRSFVKNLADLSKNVQKYADEAIKIHKTVKERQSKTYDAVNLIQTTTTCLQKAKENYFLRCMELEKLKHENGTSKEVARSEMRVRKAREEYQQYVEKYASVRVEFMSRMSEAVKHFQDIEIMFLTQMKSYMSEYAASFLGNQERITRHATEFHEKISMLDIDQLLDGFVEANQTGTDKPPVMEFEEPEASAFVTASSCGEPLNTAADVVENSSATSGGGSIGEAGGVSIPSSMSHFKLPQTVSKGKLNLWLPGRKAGRRNGPLKDTASEGSGSFDAGLGSVSDKFEPPSSLNLSVQASVSFQDGILSKTTAVQSQLPSVDQDAVPRRILSMGFLKKKSKDKRFDKGSKEMITNAFCTSVPEKVVKDEFPSNPSSSSPGPSASRKKSGSFSDSDSDDEVPSKIKLEIKPPLSDRRKMCASVDELKDVVESMSSSAKIGNRSLEMVPSNRPLKAMVLRPAKTGDDRWNNLAFAGNLSKFSVSSASIERRSRPRSATPTHMMILESSATSRQSGTGKTSPDISERTFAERQNSLGSIPEFSGVYSMNESSTSRGPSPVSGDRIPLAVAVTETIHVLFKSSNECAVRTFGNVTFSFPAGIMKMLSASGTSSAVAVPQLSFRFEGAERIQGVIGNRKVLQDFSYSGSCSTYKFDFNMNSLAEHLKLLNRRNPSAPFYNLEVLRYEVLPDPPPLPALSSSESQPRSTAAVPLLLRSFWKCCNDHTDLCITYSYNPDCRLSAPLINLLYSTETGPNVCSVTSKPEASWLKETNQLQWRFTELSRHGESAGSLKARLFLTHGPFSPSRTFVQFQAADVTFSGLDVSLSGFDYRLSLLRKRIVSGKYVCEPEMR